MMDKATKLIIGRIGLLLTTVFVSVSLYSQSFTLSYVTPAESQTGEEPYCVTIEYEVTDPENHLASIISYKGVFSNLTLPGTVIYEGEEYLVNEIGRRAFMREETSEPEIDSESEPFPTNACLTLPDEITIIGESSFANVTFGIQIGKGIKEIGEGAFKGCKTLITDQLPDELESIGSDAFRSSGLHGIIKIPLSVIEIGSGAFAECVNLNGFSVDTENSVFSVVDDVLYGSYGLHLIQYPCGKTDNSFIVPSSVLDVEDAAFAGNNHLISVSFSNANTSLWKDAFANCASLESVALPDSLEIISDRLFSGCSNLKEISIPSGVSSIGKFAFQGCSSLTALTIPKGVIVLGENCFWRCDNIQKIISFPIVPPMMEGEVFSADDVSVYTHFSSMDLYRQANQWSRFVTILPFNEIYVDEVSVYPFGNSQFDIILESSLLDVDFFDTIEFTMTMPDGFALVANSESGFTWSIPDSNQNERMIVEITETDEGCYHLFIKGYGGNGIKSGHYPLLTLSVCSNSYMEGLSYSAYIKNVQIQSAGEIIADMPSSEFSIMLEEVLIGDVNYDGKQNVVDIMSIVSYILDNEKVIPLSLADVNQDSIVDIVDVMKLVQIILENE